MAEGSAVLSSVSMFSGRRRLAGCEQPIQMADSSVLPGPGKRLSTAYAAGGNPAGLSHNPPELTLTTEKEVLTAGERDNVTTPWAYS